MNKRRYIPGVISGSRRVHCRWDSSLQMVLSTRQYLFNAFLIFFCIWFFKQFFC